MSVRRVVDVPMSIGLCDGSKIKLKDSITSDSRLEILMEVMKEDGWEEENNCLVKQDEKGIYEFDKEKKEVRVTTNLQVDKVVQINTFDDEQVDEQDKQAVKNRETEKYKKQLSKKTEELTKKMAVKINQEYLKECLIREIMRNAEKIDPEFEMSPIEETENETIIHIKLKV